MATWYGTGFSDKIYVDRGFWGYWETVYAGGGDDTVIGGGKADELWGDDGDDSLYGGGGNDHLYGEFGKDTLNGADGNDYLLGGAQNDQLFGGAGEDSLYGETGNDYLYGGDDSDYLDGGTANDTLDGGAGADVMHGGTGDDTYVVDSKFNAYDEVNEAPNSGNDTVIIQSEMIFFDFTLAANVENLILTGNVIAGIGNELNNYILGNAVDNILNGQTGIDTLVGGNGNDTYYVDSPDDVVIENANAGTDNVVTFVNYTLADNVENLQLSGSAIAGTGNSLNNLITGTDGANILDGKAGNDTMQGGVGNDIYHVDSAGDVVIEAANAGTDSVVSSVSYTLGENLEHLELAGTAAINGTGNALNNLLWGNSGDNVLDGKAGDDTLRGGAGNDTYYVDSSSDVVTEAANAGTDSIYVAFNYTLGANLENLYLTGTTATHGIGNELDNRLYGNSANNLLEGGAGNDVFWGDNGNDTLKGGTGNDWLDGGAGIATLEGGVGDDTYVVRSTSDVLVEAANAGIDKAYTSGITSYTLAANIENLELLGIYSINGTGNSLNNEIKGNTVANTLSGAAGNDSLYGFDGNDTLLGGTGNDSLDGGKDNDLLVGGAGNDTLTGGAGADIFKYNSSTEGVDRITDFSVTEDKIQIVRSGFSQALNLGELAVTQFVVGSAAQDASDRFIYNNQTGALFFDRDGSASAAQIQIATLSTGLAMTHQTIVIV
jgi:Ca2+-binding RTX toxin-like protein